MELEAIEKHARALMEVHGVGYLSFGWNNKRKAMGVTWSRRAMGMNNKTVVVAERIELSKFFAPHMSLSELNDVMLHEIAHALTPGTGHGWKWQAKCREIGAVPKPCGTVENHPGFPIIGKCAVCDKEVSHNHRMPRRVYFHKKCGMTLSTGILVWYRNGKRVELNDMPAAYLAEYHRYNRNDRVQAANRPVELSDYFKF